ncbi:MAG TPA: glycosyltransferase family 4 protein [Chloroflexota bacterium]|nr:glycosyltransferase family 4 protein [Chloroflexota bacterium]
MKVVMVSKAFVGRDAYQRKLEEIARLGDVDLTLISPPSWREGHDLRTLNPRFTRGYDLRLTPLVFNGRYHLHFYPRLPGLLAALRPDLVHVDEEPYNLATWLALRAARRVGARRLFFTWQNLNRKLPVPFSSLEAQSYRLADGAIAGIRDAESVLRAKGFQQPIWVIPQFGIDPELFQPGDRPADATFTVGFIGRLVRTKGADLLLRACRTLDDPWRAIVVGDGAERAALERLSDELGLGARVQFRGVIPSTDVPPLLHELDVLVLPSRSAPNWREQFGRVLVEAMACAVPLIGSDSGEIPRVVGDAGLIFPEEDWSVLGEQLAALRRDVDQRLALGQNGRRRVLADFTHQSIARQTVAVYRALLDAGITST